MSEELQGNCLVAQSGGPTAVINASLAGVITEALNHPEIEEIYGGLDGVLGILNEEFIDLAEESQQQVRGLRHTPGSALGTCRYKLNKSADFERVLQVFEAHNIRYFFYIGGNDSQDTADRIAQTAQQRGYSLRVIGIPKTIDNDLPGTDHCPGYGSVVKYLGTLIREIACDNESMGQHDLVSIIEVMGRNAGWIAAGSTLAKRRDRPHDPPHLVYLPEVAFSAERFLADVQRVLAENRFCLVVASEGICDQDGNYVATASAQTDAFGHAQLGGTGDYLRDLVESSLGIKARSARPALAQRAAAHISSQTDNDEAFMVGQAAVKAAVVGETGKMVTLIRGDSDQYSAETGLAVLNEVANGVKRVPEQWINEEGNGVSFPFLKYAQPLIQGEVEVPYELGLPRFVSLARRPVEKLLEPYTLAG